MPIAVKDLSKSSTKWAERASGASTEFAENAAANAETWARNTQAAEGNYRQAISGGNVAARFARGVAKAASGGKFARKIRAVGQSRYSEGVSQGKEDWRIGFEPFQQAIAGVSLPARKPRGDAGNIERVKAVTTTLNAKRLAVLASGG